MPLDILPSDVGGDKNAPLMVSLPHDSFLLNVGEFLWQNASWNKIVVGARWIVGGGVGVIWEEELKAGVKLRQLESESEVSIKRCQRFFGSWSWLHLPKQNHQQRWMFMFISVHQKSLWSLPSPFCFLFSSFCLYKNNKNNCNTIVWASNAQVTNLGARCRAFSRQFFPRKFWVKSESTPVFLSKNLSLERKITTKFNSREKYAFRTNIEFSRKGIHFQLKPV